MRNNKSGFLGVIWNKKSKKWRSLIRINGKQTLLGDFATPEEAHKMYVLAKRKHHAFNTL